MLAEAALIHCAEGFADFQLAAASLQPAVHMEKNLNGVCVCLCGTCTSACLCRLSKYKDLTVKIQINMCGNSKEN